MIRSTGSPVSLLLFAAVRERSMLDQGFYAAEVEGLRAHPAVASVATTNRLADVCNLRTDGIISYFYSHSAAVGAIAKARGIPVIATGGGEQLLRDQAFSATNYTARLAAFHACTLLLDGLLATSTSDFELMRNIAHFGRDRIALSYHAAPAVERVSTDCFRHPREFSSLVTIAGLDNALNIRRKGVLEAVDLLTKFHAQDPTSSLTIIGRATCRDIVERHAEDRGVLPHIHFTGYIGEDEKINLLRRSRFYVQLSEYEGFGVGALEALAQGCQVIHTNMGGLRDTVGRYGLIVRRESIAAFDPNCIPEYKVPNWSEFQLHLAQFGVRRRADALLRALGFSIQSDSVLLQSAL